MRTPVQREVHHDDFEPARVHAGGRHRLCRPGHRRRRPVPRLGRGVGCGEGGGRRPGPARRRRDRRGRHAVRQGARLRSPRHPLLPRHPLRRRHVRREPLHAAAEAETLDGRLPRPVVGQHRAPEHGQAVRRPVLRVPRPLELRRRERGLPAAERLHAGPEGREEAAGARVAPRRRLRQRQRHRARRLQRREPRPARRRGLRVHQPPARPARLLRPRRRRRREIRRLRQRGDARLRGRARVGPRQHRGLRRGPRQRDDHGPERRRREGLRADRDAGGQGPLPQGGGAERRLAQDGREGERREARRGRPRRGRPRAGRRREAAADAVEGLLRGRDEGAAEARRAGRPRAAPRLQPGRGRRRAAAAPLLPRSPHPPRPRCRC